MRTKKEIEQHKIISIQYSNNRICVLYDLDSTVQEIQYKIPVWFDYFMINGFY